MRENGQYIILCFSNFVDMRGCGNGPLDASSICTESGASTRVRVGAGVGANKGDGPITSGALSTIASSLERASKVRFNGFSNPEVSGLKGVCLVDMERFYRISTVCNSGKSSERSGTYSRRVD